MFGDNRCGPWSTVWLFQRKLPASPPGVVFRSIGRTCPSYPCSAGPSPVPSPVAPAPRITTREGRSVRATRGRSPVRSAGRVGQGGVDVHQNHYAGAAAASGSKKRLSRRPAERAAADARRDRAPDSREPRARRRDLPPPPQTGMPPDEPAYEGRGERLQAPEQDRQRREDERGAPRPLRPIDLLGHVPRGPRPRALRQPIRAVHAGAAVEVGLDGTGPHHENATLWERSLEPRDLDVIPQGALAQGVGREAGDEKVRGSREHEHEAAAGRGCRQRAQERERREEVDLEAAAKRRRWDFVRVADL